MNLDPFAPSQSRVIQRIALGLAVLVVTLGGCASTGAAPAGGFTLSSPDLASGSFGNKFVLKAFGCTGENVSPALVWSGVPAGTISPFQV